LKRKTKVMCVCVRGGLGSGFHFCSETGAGSDSSHHGAAICRIPHEVL